MRRPFWFLLFFTAACYVAGCSGEECKLDVVECTCPHGPSHTDECTGVCVCEPECVADYQSECREDNRVGLIDCAGVCVQGATLPDAGNGDMSNSDAGTTSDGDM